MTKKRHSKKDNKQRHCIIAACIAFAALCFLTLFSQYTDDVTELVGAAVLKNKCDTTPASYVLVGSNDNYVYALDADKGCVAWKFDTTADVKSKPALYGNTIYIGTAGDEFYSLSLADGSQYWKADNGKIFGAAAADSSYAYVGDNTGALSAYSSGEAAWTYTAHNIKADVQLDNSILYVVDEYLKVGTVRAIDTATHAQKWAFSAKSQILAPPLITSDALYVPSNENTLYKVNKNYGVPIWTFKTTKSIRTTPVMDDKGILYFGSNDGYLYAVDSATGALVWKYLFNAEISSSPAADADAVYVAVKDTVYALDTATRTVAWKKTIAGKISATLTLHDGTIFVPSTDYTLYVLNAETGEQKWSYKTSGALYAGVTVT
jgi:outer membrane protein assembly factor BamB